MNKGGKRIISAGVQNRFWGGALWYVSPPLSFPSLCFSLKYRQSFLRFLFIWDIAELLCDTLQNGVSHRCACVKLSTKGGGITPFWGAPNLPEKVSRDMGYRSDSIAMSRDMGAAKILNFKKFFLEMWVWVRAPGRPGFP